MPFMRVGDIGSKVELTVKDQDGVAVDISSATTKNFRFLDPNNGTLLKAASFTGTGSDGKLEYAFISGDLDVAGTWKVQAEIVYSGGTYTSDSISFEVKHKDIT